MPGSGPNALVNAAPIVLVELAAHPRQKVLAGQRSEPVRLHSETYAIESTFSRSCRSSVEVAMHSKSA
jgi:hypothetical protein